MSIKKTNKIEAETGEVVQTNSPFKIVKGGIAQPLGRNLYLLKGKKHEQGGIDIDLKGDARIFSDQPILNGNSPAELVTKGANPNQTFIKQERFKDVNGINDDGTRKAKCGKRIKAEWGMEEGGLADTLTDIIPIVGSAKDITRLIRNPSWKQAGRTLFSVGTDILGYKTLAGVAKLAKASKAGKIINKIDDVVYNITPNINNKFTNFLDDNYDVINKTLTETGVSAIGELIQQNNDMKNKENSNKKQLGGSTGLIRVQANGKDRLMYVPFTGEETKANRKKAKYGTRKATDGNRFMSYDRASYLLNLNKGNNININDNKIKEKINELPSETDIKSIERDVIERENLEFINDNKTKVAPKSVGKSYHTISASNSSAVARGIARKLNYNFSDHGSTDFRTADLTDAIFTNRPDTVPVITSIYGNDFVAPAGTLGSTRRAIDFKNENKNVKIDNKISVDKISRYYGNDKTGKFKIGTLNDFDDNDYIAAVRNKSMEFDDVGFDNDGMYYIKDGQLVSSTLPKGENNKHIVYSPKTGKSSFVSTTKDASALYEFYKEFLEQNDNSADIILLDNGRFEDNIYKGGRPLTDEELSDYYRNDFNRGFDKVPVLISGRMKRFGGKTTNRAKAEYGLGTSNYFNTRASILGYKPSVRYLKTNPMSFTKDEVVDVMSGTKSNLAFADPYNPNKSYSQLLSEGYFENTGFTPYGRRIAYDNRNIINSENIDTTKSSPVTTSIDNNSNNKINFTPKLTPIAGLDNIKFETPITTDIVNKITVPESLTKQLNDTYAVNKNISNNNQTNNKFKDWYSKNSDIIGGVTNALAGITGSILSNSIANKALKNSTFRSQPVQRIAVPLNTNYNITSQINQVNENLADYNRMVDESTSSNAVALERKRQAANQATRDINNLYTIKENKETDLINRSRLNQQQVANANIDTYNDWLADKSEFDRTKSLAIAQNKADMIGDSAAGINTFASDLQKSKQFKNNLAVLAAAHPNVTPELLKKYGYIFRLGGQLKNIKINTNLNK